MAEELSHSSDKSATRKKRYSREESTAQVYSFEKAREKRQMSQRAFACANEIARSTLQGWQNCKASIEAPPELVKFLESPAGLEFLHRLVLSAQLVITQMAPGGIRLVCAFLMLSGLAPFVASSYSAQRKSIVMLENKLWSYGCAEIIRLSKLMRPKKITLIIDETFHPQICLVAMEGASGFIFFEIYAENRDADTWEKEINKALKDMPVEIIQITSDEAKALIKLAKKN